jgi:hypothetical protein
LTKLLIKEHLINIGFDQSMIYALLTTTLKNNTEKIESAFIGNFGSK